MQRRSFTDFLTQTFTGIYNLNDVKGNDYSGSEDAFANFKRNAQKLGLTKFQVWSVYFFKHMDAIETWLRDSEVKSEPIEGRIDDAILYLLLLRGMIYEDTQEPSLDEETKTTDDILYHPPTENFYISGIRVSEEQLRKARGGVEITSTQQLMDQIKKETHFSSLGPPGNYTNPRIVDGSIEWELTSAGWVKV